MKTLLGTAVAVCCGLLPARATNFAVLLSGIAGESADPATPGGVVVDGFGITGPLFTGTPSEIILFKKLDKSSPLLMKACAQGKHISKAILIARRSDPAGGAGGDYLRIELKDLLISSISQGGDAGEAPDNESVRLRCSSIFYRYYPETQTPPAPAFVALASTGPDTDKDGMSDEYERHYGLNPAVNDAAGDLDGDGLSNGEEARLGYNPASGNSFFEVSATAPPGPDGGVTLAWDAIPGKPYQIEWTPDLNIRFTVLETFTPTDPAAVRRLTRTGLTGFFRVRPAP
jgi:hypothetical protein